MASTVLSEVKLLVSPQIGKVEFEFLTSLFLFDRLETMKVDPLLLTISSEVFVDLSAAWFTAVFIVPNFPGLTVPFNLLVLTMDITFGILCVGLAYKFRRLAKKI